jgi:hypothetical protein
MVSKSGITGEGLGLEFGVVQGVAPNGRGASAHELERLRAVQPCDDLLEYTMRCVLALAPQLEAEVLVAAERQVRDLFGGDRIYVGRRAGQGLNPREAARRDVRNAAIRRDFQAGERIALLTRRYGISTTQVWRIVNQLPSN